MSLERRLEGKVQLITGAASGIGLACAERFVREGAIVAGFDIGEKPDAWSEIEKAAPGSTFHVGCESSARPFRRLAVSWRCYADPPSSRGERPQIT